MDLAATTLLHMMYGRGRSIDYITWLGMCTSEYSADVPGTALEYTTAF